MAEVETTKAGNIEDADVLSKADIEEGDLRSMAKDKLKSRMLQKSILKGGPDIATLIFERTEPYFKELVYNQYGNYLAVKILEVATKEQFDRHFALLKDELPELARDVHGTRAVQKMVEQALARGKTDELLEVLTPDRIDKFARSITGFHVVVKLLELLSHEKAVPYLEKLCGTTSQALYIGKDQWGCCVLKKCIDRSEGELHERVVTSILDNALELLQDIYGNYLIQHLVISGAVKPNPHVPKIIDAMQGRIFKLSLQKFSSNVIEKCLLNSGDKDRNRIINELLNPVDSNPSEAVRMLVFHQYGNYVFQQALDVAKDPQFSVLVIHSKQLIQDVAMGKMEEQGKANRLPLDTQRRLSFKILKKYRSMQDGLHANGIEASTSEVGVAGPDGWGGSYFDPYSQSFGFDEWMGMGSMLGANPFLGAFSMPPMLPTPPGWDAMQRNAMQAYMEQTKENSASSGARRGQRGGRKKPIENGNHMEATGASGEKVGRIVGFWPNYQVTYDEATPEVNGTSARRNGIAKMNGKAAPKGKARTDKDQAAGKWKAVQ
eukprot:TRINITY_DN124299_c0_g1_i1.p1 TRINITY_DN124299_c0_g1~~TRINITY_DN124299_c0_g1_i1.p1  ORF type:complete len:549 (-),score=139.21 TRINITY_DN124299_c0_g1_i1:260-1906(-)